MSILTGILGAFIAWLFTMVLMVKIALADNTAATLFGLSLGIVVTSLINVWRNR